MASPGVTGVPGVAQGDQYTEAMYDTYVADNVNTLGSHRSCRYTATGPDTFSAGGTAVITWDATSWTDTTYFSFSGTAGTVLVDGIYHVSVGSYGDMQANDINYQGQIRLDGAAIDFGAWHPAGYTSSSEVTLTWDSYFIVSSAPVVVSLALRSASISYGGTADNCRIAMQYLGTAY